MPEGASEQDPSLQLSRAIFDLLKLRHPVLMGCLLRGLVTFLHATHVKLQVENFALQKHNWGYTMMTYR